MSYLYRKINIFTNLEKCVYLRKDKHLFKICLSLKNDSIIVSILYKGLAHLQKICKFKWSQYKILGDFI